MGLVDSLLISISVVGVATLIAIPKRRSARVIATLLTLASFLAAMRWEATLDQAVHQLTSFAVAAVALGQLAQLCVEVYNRFAVRPLEQAEWERSPSVETV